MNTSELNPRIPVANGVALDDILLRRLKRVLLLRFYTDNLLTDPDRRLLDHAIFSTFCDCQNLGLGAEGQRLLNEARTGGGVFKRPMTVGR